jgi:trans-2-enoyl-CoA reductase
MRACVLIALAGCASGFTQSTSVGVAFGGGATSLVVTFEVSAVAHEPFEASRDTITATP